MTRVIVILLFSLFYVNGYAQSIKIGFVDGVKLIEKTPQGDAAKAALEAEFKPRELQIIKLRDQISTLDKTLSQVENIKDQSFIEKKRALREHRRDLKRVQQEMREDLNLRRNEELAKLQRLISKAIIEIAKEEKYDLIIQDAVYAATSIDITKKVLVKLNTAFESGK